MPDTIKDQLNTASTVVYVVFMPRNNVYEAKPFKPDATSRQIHHLLAHCENNHPQRTYNEIVQPGSFKWVCISDAKDGDDAISQAKERGLKWEPRSVAVSAYLEAEKKKSEEATSDARQSPPGDDLFAQMFGKDRFRSSGAGAQSSPFDEIFKDPGKKNDPRP